MLSNLFDLSAIKVIATDLDGTALNKDHKLEPITAKALDLCVEKGIHVLTATGRPYKDAGYIVESMCKHPIPLVTSNGGMLNDCAPVPEFISTIPEAIVRDLLLCSVEGKISVNIFTSDRLFSSWMDAGMIHYFQGKHFGCEPLDINTLDFNDVVKVLLRADQDPDAVGRESPRCLNDIFAELEAKYSDELQIAFSQVDCLEINCKGISKINTIAKYMDYFGLEPTKNLICFGDGLNDFQMLEKARYAFVMENADERLKEAFRGETHMHVIPSNLDLGVARVLNQLFDLGLDLEPVFK